MDQGDERSIGEERHCWAHWKLTKSLHLELLKPLEVPLNRNKLGDERSCTPSALQHPTYAGVEGEVKGRSKCRQGRKSQPRGVPLSQPFAHFQGKGTTESGGPIHSPPVHMSRVPALPALAYEAAGLSRGQPDFHFPSPHFPFRCHQKP